MTGCAPFPTPETGIWITSRTELMIVIAAIYISPPYIARFILHTICTRLFVTDIVKPDSPRTRIFFTRSAFNCRYFLSSRIVAFFPVKKKSVQHAATNCEITVARAAPCTPISILKIKIGSIIRLQTAPMDTVIIPILANPCALINAFMPRLNITKSVPVR